MNGNRNLPTLNELKGQAKRLRRSLDSDGTAISHSRSLELLAHQLGYKDWNTLHAAAGNQPPVCPVKLGDWVSGQYLGQPFEGEVISVHTLGSYDRYRITLNFEQPVDVVTFDSFSAFRYRVSCNIDRHGATAEKTSDGIPHLRLTLQQLTGGSNPAFDS